MAVREVDLIGQAITATEKEIAGEAWGNEEPVLDETGDRTVETMGEGLEGQHEPDDDDDETEDEASEGEAESEEGEGEEADPEVKEPDGDAKPAIKAEGEREGRVPSGRLREANERTKTVETERDALKTQLDAERAESKRQFDALNVRMEQLATSLRAPPKPAEGEAAKPVVPDFFENPEGFLAHHTKPLADQIGQLSNTIVQQRVETNMALAHARHGDVFTKAFEAIGKLDPKNPDDRATVQRIYNSANPGEALVGWHKRTETLREVGDNPAAYREKVQAETRDALMKDPEFRKALLADLRAEATQGPDGKPNTVTRLPRSLNGAAGGNRRDADPSEFDGSDQAIAESAWR